MDDGDSSTTTALGALQTCCGTLHYAFTGKLMLISVLLFFFVCLLIAFFHLYATRFFLRPNYALRNAISTITISSQGLNPLLLKSLPLFIYAPELYNPPLECPVCLSEFENGEAGRVLPKCNHSFHFECIDMWFQSHSNCPICRALVSPIEVMENSSEVEREQQVVVMVVESACEKVVACDFSSSESSHAVR